MKILARFLNPKNDLIFKHLFGKEKNKDILIHFINDVLELTDDQRVEEVQLIPTELTRDSKDGKKIILDVLCKDIAGKFFLIEMQMKKAADFDKRAQYYAARVYGSQLLKNDEYSELRPIYLIAVLDNELFEDEVNYVTRHITLETSSHKNHLKDFTYIFIELPKFNKSIHELESNMDRWAYFLKNAPTLSDDKIEELIKSAPIFERAFEQLQEKSLTEEELMTYNTSQLSKMDELAHDKAIKNEGKIEGQIDTLIDLLKIKFSNIPDKYLEILQKAKPDMLNNIKKNLFDAKKIDDLFKK